MSNAAEYYDDARILDQLAYDFRIADYPRGLNRARINDLANGAPPYTETEVQENGISVNVNSLELTSLAHAGRMQFLQGFVKPGKYFSCQTDYGPTHDRQRRSEVVTREFNRILKNSVNYYETIRGQFAQLVLHGVSPSVWENRYELIPRVLGIEDCLLPSGTLLGFRNLPHLFLYRSFTAMELYKLVYGPGEPDPGWNLQLVESALKWAKDQASTLLHSYWPEIWSPEKQAEREKGSSLYYGCDEMPTIDCFDIYVYVDDGKKSGWVRRIILDAWSTPANTGTGYTMARRDMGGLEKTKQGDFLYTSKKRRVASNISELATWQFADLSAVAPFRYHSVRSLGFMLYALCHIQNRLRCSFMESVFEALCMLMKVKNRDDVQRALQVSIGNRKFIDDSFEFVKAQDRWQVNANLAELGLSENDKLIKSHAGTMTPQIDFKDRTEKTKFQVMAELNVTQALVGAALQQAYQYKKFEYIEMFRRGCIRNSKDPLVREFQARCVRQNVPPDSIQAELWEIEPERIMGAGNKTMELAIAEQLMMWRPMYDPASQRMILREATAALTDDPARASLLVPNEPEPSDTVAAAEGDAAKILVGVPASPQSGINELEYVQTMLGVMGMRVQKANQSGGMMAPEEIAAMNTMAQQVSQHIKVLAGDKNQAEAVAQFGQQLGMIMNMVKKFAKSLEQQMKAQAGQNGNGAGPDPETIGKIQSEQIKAQAKAQNMRESHAQKTEQRQVQFTQKLQQDAARTQAEIQRDALRTAAEIERDAIQTAAEIRQEAQRPKTSKE